MKNISLGTWDIGYYIWTKCVLFLDLEQIKSEWVSEWVSGWVGGWVGEWVSEWVSEEGKGEDKIHVTELIERAQL